MVQALGLSRGWDLVSARGPWDSKALDTGSRMNDGLSTECSAQTEYSAVIDCNSDNNGSESITMARPVVSAEEILIAITISQYLHQYYVQQCFCSRRLSSISRMRQQCNARRIVNRPPNPHMQRCSRSPNSRSRSTLLLLLRPPKHVNLYIPVFPFNSSIFPLASLFPNFPGTSSPASFAITAI